MSPTFDIIVPTYENVRELRACLQGLSVQTFSSFRVLVCVDGISQAVRSYLQNASLPFELTILDHPGQSHCGRNATRNLALPYLRSPLLAMIDSDVVPTSTWLEVHYRLLESRHCVSVGDIRYTNVADNVWARYIQQRGKNKYSHGQVIPYYYLTTGNLALPTQYFLQLGGQDPTMRTYGGGDTEFAVRLHKTFALPVVFNQAAMGYSYMNKTLNDALQQLYEFGLTNLPYLVERHPDEKHIFGVQYLVGNRLTDRIVRWLARPSIRRLLLRLVPNPLRSIEHLLVHWAVFSSIAEGWAHHQTFVQKEVQEVQ